MTDPFVVGGDAAGMSAASKAKRDAPGGEVVVSERSDWVSYGACGLPYYVRSEIADVEDPIMIEAVGSLDFGYAPPFGPVWDPVLGVAKVLDEKLR